MQNTIKCSNCSTENPVYGLNCVNCSAYLRERVVNIDLGNIIAKIIESPVNAFRKIIQSEHKNFITVIIILVSIKILLMMMILAPQLTKKEVVLSNILLHFVIVIGVFVLLVVIYSLLFKYISAGFNNTTRFRDNFTILSFSFLPFIFGLIILFPIELLIFGSSLFSNNPSPFLLKESAAYVLLIMEILVIIWQIFLSTTAMYANSKSLSFSIITALIFNFIFYFLIYYSTIKVFNL